MQEFRSQWRSQIGEEQMTHSLFWDCTYICMKLPTFRANLTTSFRCVKSQREQRSLLHRGGSLEVKQRDFNVCCEIHGTWNCDNRLWRFQFSGSVLLEKWSRTFRRIVQPSTSRVWPLKMKVGRFFEMSESTYAVAQRSLTEAWNFHWHPCDNLRADVQGCSLAVNCEVMRSTYISSLLKVPAWSDEEK